MTKRASVTRLLTLPERIVYRSYKREVKNAKSITMKNGKPATQGICPTCGAKMFRIGKG